jgi:hypothetical protein
MWHKMRRLARRAKRDQAGQSIVILAAAFVALLVIIGLAIDLGLMYIERIKLGRACDAAALAAAGDLPFEEYAARRAMQYLRENGYDPTNTEMIILGPSDASVQAILNSFGWTAPANPRGTITIDMESYEDPKMKKDKDNSADKIRVYGLVHVPMNFMRLIGFDTVPVEAQAIAENASNLDIMIVYDESGSMNDDTYCYRNNDKDSCFIQDANKDFPAGERLYLPYKTTIGDQLGPVMYDDREILVSEAEYFTYSSSYSEHPYWRAEYGPDAEHTFWMLQRVADSQASGYRWEKGDMRGAHLMHMPYRGDIDGHGTPTGNAPRLDYDFVIPDTAPAVDSNWYVWIRAQCGAFAPSGPRVDGCVLHWGIDGEWQRDESTEYADFGERENDLGATGARETGSNDNRWVWVRLGDLLASRGQTVRINLWGGGMGFRLDKVLLTRDATGPVTNRPNQIPDRAPLFIQETTPAWNEVQNSSYQTYYRDKRNGGPPDTNGRTIVDANGEPNWALLKCNPIYGMSVNVGKGCTVGEPPTGSCVDLDGNGVMDRYEICDNTVDDMFDDQQPVRAAKEAAKNFLKYLRAPYDQVGFIGYSTKFNQDVARELNCILTPARGLANMPSGDCVTGAWRPENSADGCPAGPDDAWIWCYDHRLGTGGYTGKRSGDETHGSVVRAIEDMKAAGWTNIADGMREAIETIGSGQGHAGRPSAIKVMILLTDGVANRYPKCEKTASNPDCQFTCIHESCQEPELYEDGGPPEDSVMYYAREAQRKNIVVYTIGLGMGADHDLLKAVADQTGGLYYFAPTADELNRIFQEIAQQIFLRLVG